MPESPMYESVQKSIQVVDIFCDLLSGYAKREAHPKKEVVDGTIQALEALRTAESKHFEKLSKLTTIR